MTRTACLGCTMVEDDDGTPIGMYVSGCPTHDPGGERHPSATIQSWYVDGQRESAGARKENADGM